MLTRFLPGVVASLLLLTACPAAIPVDDLALIKQRLRERYLAEWAPGSAAMEVEVPESIDVLLGRLQADGTWSDVRYDVPATVGQVGFPAFPHVARTRKLAAAYAGNDPRRAALSDAIHRALAVWIKADPQTGHHWFVEIGAPIELGKAAVLFEEELTTAERAGIVRLMEVSRRPDGVLYYATKPATGQNLIWEATLQIVSGCLKNDPAYVARYARRAEEEMKPVGLEGVKVDWSFHQHGPQLSSGAYGVGFVNDCARLAAVLHGTAFALRQATVDMVTGCVLDGDQWMIRGRAWDFSPTARNIVWPRVTAAEILPACTELAALGGPRSNELEAMARRLRGEAPPSSAPTGNRLFWTSDYMTHARPAFYASVKMSSTRTYGNESGNGQGEKTNYHLGDGAFCLMIDGGEYRGIFPLWDWRRVPGVTCVYPDEPQPPLPSNIWGRGSEGGSAFVGGVSDGNTGVATMELKRAQARARKSWFFLDGAVVCLGNGIDAENNLPITTSINQSWARSEVAVAGAGSLPQGETLAVENPAWVHHDGVAYLFPHGGNVRVRRETKQAAWQTINTLTGIKEPAAGDVFALWLEHGRGAVNGRYAYIVIPGIASAQAAAALPEGAIPRILANDAKLQLVSSPRGEVIQAVFWQAGEAALPGGTTLKVDEPCALQLRRNDQAWQVSAGNPSQQPRTLHVTIARPRGAPGNQTFTFHFPGGDYAGRSLTKVGND